MTARTFTPRDYQRAIISHILDRERCNVWAGMGTGKTSSTLAVLDVLHNVVGEDRPTLVLAPKRVALSTWPDEARKWSDFTGLEVVPVIGDMTVRKDALKRDVPVFTCNYDNLVWLVEHFGDKWPFGTIIADEATRLKSFRIKQGGARAQALGKVAHKHTKRFVNLTGTPAPNGLRDLWGQAWFLDAGQRLGRSFSAFEQRWFRNVAKPGAQYSKLEPLEHAQIEIETALRDITITVRAEDYLDLPPLITNTIYVDLPASARKHYRDMEREMFTSIEGNEVEAFNAAAKTMKCLQLANGAMYLDPARYEPGTWVEVHDAKLEALESVINEAAGMPILVAYHFKSDLARLQRAFPKGRSLDADPATIASWNAGGIPLLFAHPASAGHGLSLQDGGNIIAFFGHWWNLEERQQIIERIGPTRQVQSGHNRPVYVHNIVARGTIDELVLQRHETKAEVQSLLLQAMRGPR